MKTLFTFLLSISSMAIFAQGFTSENFSSYTGKTYTCNYLLGNIEFALNKDNTYSAKYESEGYYWSCSGTWKFNEKMIIEMEPAVCFDNNGDSDCSKTLGKATAELVKDNISLDYAECIKVTSLVNNELLVIGEKGNSFQLGVEWQKVPEGSKRKFEETEIIMMGEKAATAATGVYIRTTPSVKGTAVKYIAELSGTQNDFVPKGTSVTVIARTTEKDKLDKYENYWYLVNVGTNYRVWMYAEFVKLNK